MLKRNLIASLFFPSVAVLIATGCSTTVVKNPEEAKAVPEKKVETAQNEPMAAPVAAVDVGADQYNIDKAKQLASSILPDLKFETGSANLTHKAQDDLKTLAGALAQAPSVTVRIDGYTDNTGPDALNRELSQERADAVKLALTENGIAPARITTMGHASANPVADNSDPTGRAQNRRADIAVG